MSDIKDVPIDGREVDRAAFETWVYSIEHKPYGWLGKEWLERKDDSYASDYVHGLWVGYCARFNAEGSV